MGTKYVFLFLFYLLLLLTIKRFVLKGFSYVKEKVIDTGEDIKI